MDEVDLFQVLISLTNLCNAHRCNKRCCSVFAEIFVHNLG